MKNAVSREKCIRYISPEGQDRRAVSALHLLALKVREGTRFHSETRQVFPGTLGSTIGFSFMFSLSQLCLSKSGLGCGTVYISGLTLVKEPY